MEGCMRRMVCAGVMAMVSAGAFSSPIAVGPGKDYDNVSAAVSGANTDDEIVLGAGTYEFDATLSVNKRITLRGADGTRPDEVVLQASANYANGPVVTISAANAMLSGLTICGGTNTTGSGGAVLFNAAGMVSNCVIHSCYANCGPAASGSGTLTDCVISNNVGTGGNSFGIVNGGTCVRCVLVGNSGNITLCGNGVMRFCTLVNNTVNCVTDNGGSLWACQIIGNTFSKGDGALGWSGNYYNCLIARNRTAGTFIAGGSVGNIYSCTFADNVRSSAGGQFFNSNTRAYNCIVYGNDGWSTIHSDVSKFDSGFTDIGSEDPVPSPFADSENGDYSILYTSPCFNAGSQGAKQGDVDCAGNPRVKFDQIDIGCYELQTLPASEIMFSFDKTTQIIFPDESVTIAGTVCIAEGLDSTVTWDFGDGTEPYEEQVTGTGFEIPVQLSRLHTYSNAGGYSVTVTVVHSACPDGKSVVLTNRVAVKTASARDIWVDSANGNDSAAGTEAEPWRTFSLAVACLRDGQTVRLLPGTYRAEKTIELSAGNKLCGEANAREDVIIRPDDDYVGDFSLIVIKHASSSVCNLVLEGGTNRTDKFGSGSGGAVLFKDNVAGTVSNCVIRSCYANYGPATSGNGKIVDCVISNNVGSGGTAYGIVNGGTCTRCVLAKNSGNITVSGKTTMNSCTLVDNDLICATDNGGSLWACQIIGNTFSKGDGALGNSGNYYNCLIAGNRTAATFIAGGSVGNICNCTFVGNVRNGDNGIFFHDNNYPHNCIVYGNSGWSRIAMTAGKFDSGFTDLGAEDDVPSPFADIEGGDYNILYTSPCFNAGSQGAKQGDIDCAGNPRVKFDQVDIGCYELQTLPASEIALSFDATAQVISAGESVTIAGTVCIAEGLVSTVTWDFGDGTEPYEEQVTGRGFDIPVPLSQQHTYQRFGGYSVTVKVVHLECPNGKSVVLPNIVAVKTASARDIWVDSANGSDSAEGTEEDPLQDIFLAISCLHNGQTVRLLPGTYRAEKTIELSAGNKLCGEANAREDVIIRPSDDYACNYNLVTIGHANSSVCNLVFEGGTNRTDKLGTGSGGAVLFNQNAAGMVSNCVIRSCYANYGPATSGAGTIVDCVISNNVGTAGNGSGIVNGGTCVRCVLVGNSGNTTLYSGTGAMKFCTLVNNTVNCATDTGGNLWSCKIIGNVFSKGDGALGWSGNYYNCLIVSNQTQATFIAGGQVSIYSCTFADNVRKSGDGQFFHSYTSPHNCIVYGNTGWSSVHSNLGSVDTCFTDIGSEASLRSPFVSRAKGNYAIKPTSPCFNAGNQAAKQGDVDCAGNPRVKFDSIDIGCYECQFQNSGLFIIVK